MLFFLSVSLFGSMLSSVLQTVCRCLSDSSQVVRSAALFALGQFSEHLQVSPQLTVIHTLRCPALNLFMMDWF